MLQTDRLDLKMFEGFSPEELDDLKKIIECLRFEAGTEILRQNQRATNLYIVVNGEVEIFHKPDDAPNLSVGKLSSGGVFGWSSILGRDVYSSTVLALTECSLYRMRAFELQNFASTIMRQAWYYWKRSPGLSRNIRRRSTIRSIQ